MLLRISWNLRIFKNNFVDYLRCLLLLIIYIHYIYFSIWQAIFSIILVSCCNKLLKATKQYFGGALMFLKIDFWKTFEKQLWKTSKKYPKKSTLVNLCSWITALQAYNFLFIFWKFFINVFQRFFENLFLGSFLNSYLT